MLPPVFGVLFDGIAYGMLLFVLSVGLSVTLGLMNFVNLAHCAFAMLGGYVTATLVNDFHWPFLATLPVAFVAAAVVSVAARAHALPPALPRQRSRSGAAHHRHRVHFGRGRRLHLHAPTSSRSRRPPSCAARWRFSASASATTAVPDRRGAAGDAAAGRRARIHPLRRAGARRGRQPAHGARARHRRRPHLCRRPSRSARGLAGLGGALAIEIVGLDPNFSFTYLVYVLIVVSVGGWARSPARSPPPC